MQDDNRTEFKGGKKQQVGTPQGGVISPLLANIYMHLVDKIVNNPKGLFYKQGINIVRYADDFVLLGKRITEAAMEKLRRILARMGLKLNEQKTRQVQAKEKPFNFLGYTVRFDRDIYRSNKRYMSKREIRHYLVERLYRYYNHKSQRRSRLYGTQAFEILVSKYGLIDPTKYSVSN